jgi:hypothetical protein
VKAGFDLPLATKTRLGTICTLPVQVLFLCYHDNQDKLS